MRRLIPTAALLAGLTLAACGDDADNTETTSAESAAPTAAPATGAPATMSATTEGSMSEGSASAASMAGPGTIVDVAVGAGDFTTLVSAVQAAGLAETLSGDGPFTVFAPTDEAFAALPAGTLDTLLDDPTGDLADILKYHVVSGDVPAADVVGLNGQEVTTVNGASFTVNVDGDKVSLMDAAGNTVNVVQTDVTASNGVIHVIDGVLLPG